MKIYSREGSPYLWFSATVNGRPIRQSTKQAKPRAAKEAALRIIAEESAKAERQGGQWRLGDVLDVYYTDKGSKLESADATARYFRRFNQVIGRETDIMSVNESVLVSFSAQLRGSSKRGISMVTMNRHFSMLQAAMRWANRVYKANVPSIDWITIRVKENEGRVRYANEPDLGVLLEAANPRIRPIIVAAVSLGLRKANILSLRWYQVDFTGRMIIIERTKGRKSLVARIAVPLMAVLSNLPIGSPNDRVFDVVNFRKLWEAALKRADMDNFRFHDLRHTFATHALLKGASLPQLQQALGHADIKTTMRYAHVEAEDVMTVFDRAGRIVPENIPAQNLHNGAET